MKIAIIGSGVVGIGQGLGCLQLGHEILFYDPRQERLDIVAKQNLQTTDKLDYAIKYTDLCFICVPTPYKDGIDLSAIHDVSGKIAQSLEKKNKYYTVVVKSTVVPGTTETVVKPYFTERDLDFGLCMNPEFLTEIATTWTDDTRFKRDFWSKERIVIGEMDKRSGDVLEELYKPVGAPIFRVDLKTAELCKYAANTMLATKISFWNEMFLLCNDLGIECDTVAKITALDGRIGRYGTVHGKAFGGSCLIAGTKIRTIGGLVNIEDIKKGDLVYDGRGLTQVIGVSERISTKNMEIMARGRKIGGSVDHIHYVVENGRITERLLGDIKVGDYIFMPYQNTVDTEAVILGKNPSKKIRWWRNYFVVNQDFARLMGLFMAEGTVAKHPLDYSIIWYFGGHEEYLAKEVMSILLNIGIHSTKKFTTTKGTYGVSRCWRVRCRQKGLKMLMEQLGINGKAKNKVIKLLPNGVAESFIGGWLDGDGSMTKGTVSGHSESIQLIHLIDTMLICLGINAVIQSTGKQLRVSDREGAERVCSWTKRLKFAPSNYINGTFYKSPTMSKIDGGWAIQVSRVRKLPKQKVYAIETESGKYIANGILTHNCLPKDIAAMNKFTRDFYKGNIKETLLEKVEQVNQFMAQEYGVRE